MSDPFEHFDAAYVLGALSPGERTLFEQHLLTCAACAGRVAEVGGLPEQLSVLSAADVLQDAPPLPDTVLPTLLRAAGRHRRRTRRLFVGIGAVAAAAVVALAILIWPSSSAPPRPLAMRAVPGAPVSATVRLISRTWGTELDVHCRYAKAGSASPAVPYVLVVAGTDGSRQTLSRWKLGPGDEGDFVGATDFERDAIDRISIQLLPSRLTVLTLDV
jgi:hypothetical protein